MYPVALANGLAGEEIPEHRLGALYLRHFVGEAREDFHPVEFGRHLPSPGGHGGGGEVESGHHFIDDLPRGHLTFPAGEHGHADAAIEDTARQLRNRYRDRIQSWKSFHGGKKPYKLEID
jgi:hypothetical protein